MVITIILNIILQISMNGFAGFDFGSQRKSVIQIMSNKESAKLVKSSNDTLTYQGSEYNGLPIKYWQFIFTKNKLKSLNLEFDGDKDAQAIYFRSLSNTITKNYGKYTTIEQNQNKLIMKWLFYFPRDEITVSTFIKINLTKNGLLNLEAGFI